MPFIPHTDADVKTMLDAIGVNKIADLFDEIPPELFIDELTSVPSGLNEMELTQLIRKRAKHNKIPTCFIGAGAYEHHIPAAVWQTASRGEFMTAYTPYQAEASQGSLQLIYEFQTMMAELTGMDVANASLYDGATALAEAVLMAVRCNRKSKSKKILMPLSVHPHYRHATHNIVHTQGIELIEVPFDQTQGIINLDALTQYANDDITALVIAQPNFFGNLEHVDELTQWAHEHNILVVSVVNPTSLGLLKPPGLWGKSGADIVCGEGQPLGIPLACGGPYFGFMSCQQQYIRQMPGRIVGRTHDANGKEGFTLTLQAREQHIRRGKAKSNICTNQGLLVTAATIYLSLMGPQGLERVAAHAHANLQQLIAKVTALPDVEILFKAANFHEAVLRFKHPVKDIIKQLGKAGILAGYPLTEYYPELGECLLVCTTETKTDADLEHYVSALAQCLQKHNVNNATECVRSD